MPTLFDSETAARKHATHAFAGGDVDPTAFSRAGRSALGALLAYVARKPEGRRRSRCARRPPKQPPRHMAIDAATRVSLELLVTQRGTEKGSLRDEIDLCVTPAGSRLLARRLAAPLRDAARDQCAARCGRGARRRHHRSPTQLRGRRSSPSPTSPAR